MDNDSVDLIITSPPYADRRSEKYTGDERFKYEGTPLEEYVEWFKPIAFELKGS